MRTFHTLDEVVAAAGSEIGSSDWLIVDQERIDTFADATNDHQWIHVDEARAAAGPYAGTIAHGFLTLSLLPFFANQVFALETPGVRLNYGMEKVRFPAPVPVNSRLRSHVRFGAVTELGSGLQVVVEHTVEIEGHPKPACVAAHVTLIVEGP
jgi:acyl dehydratase